MAFQRFEACIDHVRIAAQVRDVVGAVRRELVEELLHVPMAHVGVRMRRIRRRQFARETRHEAEMVGMPVGERPELLAVQQFLRVARTEQQHHAHATLADQCVQLRQHRAIRRDAGARGDEQVTRVRIAGHEAEAPERAARIHAAAVVQPFKQSRRRAARHVAHRDLHRFARTQRVVVDRRQRIAALGRGAIGVLEMHLDELPGDEIQRLAIVSHERVMAHARGEHAAGNEFEREVLDGHGSTGRETTIRMQQCVAGAPTRGRLYYRLSPRGRGAGLHR